MTTTAMAIFILLALKSCLAKLSEKTQPQLSQLAEPLWTNPGLKSGISVRELSSTLKKKKKKCRWGMNG